MGANNYDSVKDTIKTLKKVLDNSSVGGKDKKKAFIVNKIEESALKTVIKLLNDLI